MTQMVPAATSVGRKPWISRQFAGLEFAVESEAIFVGFVYATGMAKMQKKPWEIQSGVVHLVSFFASALYLVIEFSLG